MQIRRLYEKFLWVAEPIILKIEILRTGLKFTDAAKNALKERDDILFKGFWLFSYDRGEPVMYGEKIPFLIRLKDETPIQVRTNENSPYYIDYTDGKYMLCDPDGPLEEIFFDRSPKYYSKILSDGTPMASIVQAVGDLLFVTINKYCEMWKGGNQCLFCDFNAQTRTQSQKGEATIVRKTPEVIADVLEIAFHEPQFRYMLITGGSILSSYEGKNEVEYYCEHLNTIRKRLRVWYPAAFQIGALKEDDWKRIYDTGIGTVEPNIEVWDKRLFQILCPGKEKAVGYDEWIRRTIKAVDIFGPGNVVPNFVTGIEMAKPYGFERWEDAVKSTLDGFDYLMDYGVLPRMDMWCIEPNSVLAKYNPEPPPIEYYVHLEKGYMELREKHDFMTLQAGISRYSYIHNCACDFAYYHGNGPGSKKILG